MLGLILGAWLSLAWGRPGALDEAWREIRYRGRTQFVVVADSSGVRLSADAVAGNSGLVRALPRGARLKQLRWKWRVLRHPEGADTSHRSGDDRAAGIMVLVHRSLLPWRTRALLYQWSPGASLGPWVSSPYARDIRVLNLSRDPAGEAWFEVTRDVARDLREVFGEDVTSVEAIGVICDADNTGDRATAEFGEIQIDYGLPDEPVAPKGPAR